MPAERVAMRQVREIIRLKFSASETLSRPVGNASEYGNPRAGSFRFGGRDYLVLMGGIIPLRRAASSRYDGRIRQESAARARPRSGRT